MVWGMQIYYFIFFTLFLPIFSCLILIFFKCLSTSHCEEKIKEFVTNGYKSKILPLPVSFNSCCMSNVPSASVFRASNYMLPYTIVAAVIVVQSIDSLKS